MSICVTGERLDMETFLSLVTATPADSELELVDCRITGWDARLVPARAKARFVACDFEGTGDPESVAIIYRQGDQG